MGGGGRLSLGERVGLSNTLLNVSSTIFGQNVIVNTGVHRLKDGKRAALDGVHAGLSRGGGSKEVPTEGYDVVIDEGF